MLKFSIMIIFLSVLVVPVVMADKTNQPEIRNQYGKSNPAPDHLVFRMLLYSMENSAYNDPIFAAQIVQANMRLATINEAESFLTELLATKDTLDLDTLKREQRLMCGSANSNNKYVVYKKMDAADDLREDVARQIYNRFRAGLDREVAGKLSDWLQDEKKGFSHLTLDHQSAYEGTQSDAVAIVDHFCNELELLGIGR